MEDGFRILFIIVMVIIGIVRAVTRANKNNSPKPAPRPKQNSQSVQDFLDFINEPDEKPKREYVHPMDEYEVEEPEVVFREPERREEVIEEVKLDNYTGEEGASVFVESVLNSEFGAQEINDPIKETEIKDESFLDFSDDDTIKKAIIYSEIFKRKY